MKTHFLVIDESGAKGYSKSPEKYEGEFGVMAGFLMPEEYYEIYKEHFETSLENIEFFEKRHITEAFSKEEARNAVFDIFHKGKIPWIYEAIFTQGLYESEFSDKRGGNKSNKELLHSKLFKGIIIKAFESLHKSHDEGVKLTVTTDNIDTGVQKKLEKEIENFVTLLRGQTATRISSFQKQKYITKAKISPESKFSAFSNIELGIVCDDSAMTIAADILANSANHYLKRKFEQNKNIKLNSKQAIADHPLSYLLLHVYDESDQDALDFSDLVYRRNTLKSLD